MNRSKTITTVLAGAVIGAITLFSVTPIKSMVNKVRTSKSSKSTKTSPVSTRDEDDHFFI